MDLPALPFTVLDTETTGLIPRVNRIIEFASMRIERGDVVDTYEQLFSVPQSIPLAVQVLTRIRDADLEGKPVFADLHKDIQERIGSDTILVGQNISFDLHMLKGEGIDLTRRPWIDTSMLASLLFPELPSYSLGSVSALLHLRHEPMHRALGDVRATLELLERCWQRLQELPEDYLAPLRSIMERSPEGYRRFFAALGKDATAAQKPAWLAMPAIQAAAPPFPANITVPPLPERGTVQLIEEPLHPGFSQQLLSALAKADGVHWVGVKNLDATLRLLSLSEGVRVVRSPSDILDPESTALLAQQQQYSADEATLATKLAWYEPRLRSELPLHGDEIPIWNGKVSCTETSEEYRSQFEPGASVYLLNHWQLLHMLADPEHPGHAAMSHDAHIVIDDASMLEDTATKAYGWYCPVTDIRAAAEGNEALTRFTDLLQLWIEKTRAFQDVRYLIPANVCDAESAGLRHQLNELLAGDSLAANAPIRRHLSDLAKILDPDAFGGRICWLEQRQDGNQYLQSVPEHIGAFLQKNLYNAYPTTLLIPPGSSENLRTILPPGTKTTVHEVAEGVPCGIDILFDPKKTIDDILANPPEGKSVILAQSRKHIEDAYVRHAIPLEEKEVTLICQNFSGGMGRMRAAFAAAPGTAIWIMTPWSFELVDLPGTPLHHLFLESLPFDHPAHTVLSKRAAHFRNAFEEYALPRLLHRLFRLLRTFGRNCAPGADVVILDARLESKRYGKNIWQYLQQFCGDDSVQQASLW